MNLAPAFQGRDQAGTSDTRRVSDG